MPQTVNALPTEALPPATLSRETIEEKEQKQLKFFMGSAHGTELFYTSHKDEFRQLLLDFLEDLR